MRICPRNPGACALCERLGEEADELFWIDKFREGVSARFDEPEHLLGRYDREEIRERGSCDRREEEMTTWLEKRKKKVSTREEEVMGACACAP